MKSRYNLPGKVKLTPREQQIYDIIVSEGVRQVDIARQLGIEASTVKEHMKRIFQKLGTESVVQMVVWHYTKNRKEISGE